jgi:hypothetical protein
MGQLNLSKAFATVEGLPRPQWDLVQALAEVAPMGADALWTELGRQWLSRLCTTLGQAYTNAESDRVLLLVPPLKMPTEALLRFTEACLTTLLSALPGVTEFRLPGKQIILIFRDAATYYDYISPYYPAGYHGASGGVHLRDGHPHIALQGTNERVLQASVAHELTLAALHHLALPQWVEEGLAQMFARNLGSQEPFHVDAAAARRHKRYWTAHGLGAVWRGEGFSRPGRVQGLSYQLAELLIRLLIEDHRPRWLGLDRAAQRRLAAFLRDARAEDSGESAARAHLGFGLGDLVAKFLGPGTWGPSVTPAGGAGSQDADSQGPTPP